MGMLYPKITNVFYFTGSKVTAPNCPIEMLPHYNPSNGAQFFRSSDAACSSPAYFGLPFFLNKNLLKHKRNEYYSNKICELENTVENSNNKSFWNFLKSMDDSMNRDRAEGGAGEALAPPPPLFCKNKNKLIKK